MAHAFLKTLNVYITAVFLKIDDIVSHLPLFYCMQEMADERIKRDVVIKWLNLE
jgi:hypothetical protein